MLIDAHLHQWDPRTVDYPWLAGAPAQLRGPHLVTDIAPAMEAGGVTHAILVQAADSAADTAAMLAAADRHPWIAGVVAWAPLQDPKACVRTIAGFDSRVVGVRALIHDWPDSHFILSDTAAASLAAVAEAGLAFDFVTSSPEALAHVPAIAAAHPDLTIVIDHLGKPPLGGDHTELDRWTSLLTAAARHPRVVAKASGLYGPQGNEGAWTRGDVRRVLDVALTVLGPERLMLGSDWPLTELAGGRERVWAALIAETDMLRPSQREQVRWRTAARTYLGKDT